MSGPNFYGKKDAKKHKKPLTFVLRCAILFCVSRLTENAGVAQLVEQLICNQQVGGSSPSTSSTIPAKAMRIHRLRL